jgi:ABC-type branched-subunit amino acid transport system ATPase component
VENLSTSTEAQIESSSNNNLLLDVEKVTMSFGGLTALSQVSLNIRPEEVLGLIQELLHNDRVVEAYLGT